MVGHNGHAAKIPSYIAGHRLRFFDHGLGDRSVEERSSGLYAEGDEVVRASGGKTAAAQRVWTGVPL